MTQEGQLRTLQWEGWDPGLSRQPPHCSWGGGGWGAARIMMMGLQKQEFQGARNPQVMVSFLGLLHLSGCKKKPPLHKVGLFT